jgi:predicted alpha/beta superfamily hydrolase
MRLFKLVLILVTLSFLLLFLGCSGKNPHNSNNEPNQDSTSQNIPGLFYSEIIDDNFIVYLDLPDGYDVNLSQGYHVVYLLDGDWYFDGSHYRLPNGGTVSIVESLTSDGTIPDVIIIAIGYPGDNLRQRDFLYPYNSSNPISGGGEDFYNFLKDELIPVVDNRFNTQGNQGRTLIGHSYGGYFAMFSLFHYRPTGQILFNNYLAISPANYYRSFHLKTMDNLMALEINNNLPLNLYMSVGSLEWDPMQEGIDTFVNRFNSRNYNNFDFNWVRYSNLNHGTVVRPSITDGMTWFFNH